MTLGSASRYATVAGVVAAALAVPVLGIRVNRTASLPYGVYRTLREPAISRGDLIRFCMPESAARALRARPYAGSGRCAAGTQELAKVVVALPGDEVIHTRGSVAINGRTLPASPTHAVDSRGRPLPHPRYGRTRLTSGEFWVHSPYAERSLDSRYLGPVPLRLVGGRIAPLLTYTSRAQEASLRVRGEVGSAAGAMR